MTINLLGSKIFLHKIDAINNKRKDFNESLRDIQRPGRNTKKDGTIKGRLKKREER